MTYDEMRIAIRQAVELMEEAEGVARTAICNHAAGKLKRLDLDHGTLCDLKRELAHYDMHRAKWTQ